MDKVIKMELPAAIQEDQAAQQPEPTDEAIQRTISLLVHACKCLQANCRRMSCPKMKRVISHARFCRKRQQSNSSCPVCKQLIALCIYHAKRCSVEKCPVPFCLNVRQMVQEKQHAESNDSDNNSGGSGNNPNTPDVASNSNVASQQQ